MKQTEILVVGKHPEIMKTINRLINNKPGWNCSSALTADEALAFLAKVDVVLLGPGLTTDESTGIRKKFSVPVVQHYGGGSGLLYAEIYQALSI